MLINDHPHEERGVDVRLPGVWRDRTWARVRKDRLRWDRTQEFELAGHDEAGLHLHDVLPPMSIQAYTTEQEMPRGGTGGR